MLIREISSAVGKIDLPIALLKMSSTYFAINGKAAMITLFESSSLPLARLLKWSMDSDMSFKVTAEKEKREKRVIGRGKRIRSETF